MINRMSAAEYQRLVVKPARDAAADDDEFIKQLQGNSKKKPKKKTARDVVKDAENFIDKGSGRLSGFNVFETKKLRNNEEDELTEAVANYLEELKIKGRVMCYSHIPNSTFTRSWSVKKRNTAMGVRAGVPDMLIVFPDKVLFLELKRLKGGVVSPYQKEWITALAATGKVEARVAAGFDEAKAVIDSCLE